MKPRRPQSVLSTTTGAAARPQTGGVTWPRRIPARSARGGGRARDGDALGVGVRRHPGGRRRLSPGSLALGRLTVGSSRWASSSCPRAGPAVAPRPGVDHRLGAALVRRLQRDLEHAERHVDAGTAAMLVNIWPDLHRPVRRALPGRGLPAAAARGLAIAFGGRRRDRRSRARRRAAGAAPDARLCLGAALAYAAGGRRPEAALRATPALHRHLAGVRDRDDRLPAVRARTRRPAGHGAGLERSAGSSTSASSRPRSHSRRGPSR